MRYALAFVPLALAALGNAIPRDLFRRSSNPATGIVLKNAAKPRYFAAAIGEGHLTNETDPFFRDIAAAEYSGLTPENEMKWEIIEPEQGVFNFTPADVIVEFGQQHGYTIRGHTMVWHNQLAPYVANLSASELLADMELHITTILNHFKGKLYAFDIVNEALNDNGTLSDSPFLTALGPSYIETAFTIARKANTGVKLYYNDFNTEGVNEKSDALLEIVKDLKSKNLIDGVGFQSHFIVGEVPTTLQQNFQRFVDAGVEVAITELDIRANTPVNISDIMQQEKDYATVINACQAVKKCVGITTWGITDLYSWIPGTFPGQGFGLLWDDVYGKVPSYFATIQALVS